MDHPMPRTSLILVGSIAATALLSGCGDEAALPRGADSGPNPTLPKPVTSSIPTVNVAPAKGWTAGDLPTAASGLSVAAFARGLNHPRSILVLPNGDVLVAESNAPPKE
jgi:glucose/arabinose dehydrogenase